MPKIYRPKPAPIPFTEAGYKNALEEQAKLLAERPDAVEHLRKAREMGDLSENGYYKAAKQRLVFLDARLRRIDRLIRQGVIVKSAGSGKIDIGSTVTITDGTREFTYEIVGGYESDPSRQTISYISPIGKALMGHIAGDEIQVTVPSGLKKVFHKNSLMNAKDYYKKEIMLAHVDAGDQIVGQVERWKAHENGILHRGFTAILMQGDTFLLQHRKHPAFDKYWDLTFSSHQVFMDKRLQSDSEAILVALGREWNLARQDVTEEPQKLGSIYYQAKDPGSIYTEHEVDEIYLVKVDAFPQPVYEYSYGVEKVIAQWEDLPNRLRGLRLAPWVGIMLAKITLHF